MKWLNLPKPQLLHLENGYKNMMGWRKVYTLNTMPWAYWEFNERELRLVLLFFFFFRSRFSSVAKLGRKKIKESENSGRINRDWVINGKWAVSWREKQERYRFILGKVGAQQFGLKGQCSGSWFGSHRPFWACPSCLNLPLIATWPRFSYALAHRPISQNHLNLSSNGMHWI